RGLGPRRFWVATADIDHQVIQILLLLILEVILYRIELLCQLAYPRRRRCQAQGAFPSAWFRGHGNPPPPIFADRRAVAKVTDVMGRAFLPVPWLSLCGGQCLLLVYSLLDRLDAGLLVRYVL